MLTMESKIREVYSTPVGHDILYKILLQLNLSEKMITNPVIGSLKLKTLAALTGKMLGPGFYDAFLTLLNSEKNLPGDGSGPISHAWWKEAVFYQIYPRSFYDSNGDGIGDLRGIIDKLDYLADLGVTALWLSPIYDSPQDDNGYDIRDYHKIAEEFGTMEDFDELLEKTHARGMRLIMDLVVNHTSDEHAWFQNALKDENSPYRGYYFFQQGDKDTPPNNWTSFFSGSAWNYYEEEKLWALHLFSKKQMDLNWENPAVRKEVTDMVNWWLDKGVDGFRMDVINYISKQPGLPMGDETIGNMMGYTGIEHYFYGPRLHEYLHELHENAFAPHNAFSVGETPGIGMNMCRLVTGEERKELDMVFSFDHLETPGHVRWDDYQYDLTYFRDYMTRWLTHYGNNCWMSVFYNNHDNPRMISKVNPDPRYAPDIAILLAVMQFTLKGTPFLFQGDEMGLLNYAFSSIDEITDVEAKGYYRELLATKTPEEAFATILAGTREHTRVLLPWNFTSENTATAGYPEHLRQTPNRNVTEVYKKLIALRKSEKALTYGDFKVFATDKQHFTYARTSEEKEFIIDCNLGERPGKAYRMAITDYQLVFASLTALNKPVNNAVLAPYEARIWVRKKL